MTKLGIIALLTVVTTAYSNEFKPGTYTATRKGHNANITVEVKTSKDRIEDIKVVSHKETEGLGTVPFELMRKDILEHQTLNVDNISGATVSARAYMTAVRTALQSSGIDVAKLNKKIPIEPALPYVISRETDVIIVGSGGAGYAAAATITENNGNVIMLDKMAFIGGNTVRSGATLNAVDSKRQTAIGVKDSEDHFFKNTMEAGDNKANPELVRTFVNNSMGAREWLSTLGTEWTEVIYQTIGGLWPRSMNQKEHNAYAGFIAPLKKVVDGDSKNETLTNVLVTDLISNESGRVIGVKARNTKNGQEYEFYGKRGVILATGGYAANEELLEKYHGIKEILTSNTPSATGDGLVLATKVGADLEGMADIQIHPHGNPMTGALQSHFAGNVTDSIYVNKEGKRFVSEQGRRDEISNAILKQTDQVMFAIYDSQQTLNSDIEEFIALGDAYKADTLEALAKKVEVEPTTLLKTVENFNKMVIAKKDTEFNKELGTRKLEKGPFYAVPLSATAHHTMGGLSINTKAQVLDKNKKPIEGLYAAGEVTGGIHGGNRIGGNALTDVVVFGRIAGQTIMN